MKDYELFLKLKQILNLKYKNKESKDRADMAITDILTRKPEIMCIKDEIPPNKTLGMMAIQNGFRCTSIVCLVDDNACTIVDTFGRNTLMYAIENEVSEDIVRFGFLKKEASLQQDYETSDNAFSLAAMKYPKLIEEIGDSPTGKEAAKQKNILGENFWGVLANQREKEIKDKQPKLDDLIKEAFDLSL